MNNREFCIKLAKAESSLEVKTILKETGYWDDLSQWRAYGDQESNSGIVSNQQDSADGALVEKITNAVDALLLRECYRRGLNPESSSNVPKSLSEATLEFFNIRGGALESAWDIEIREISDLISIVATGDKKTPCIHIIDKGIGQTPQNFPNTLVSLLRGNKNKVRFVQGQFNMGATGVIAFCGEDGLQLIVSKRDPDVVKVETRELLENGHELDPTRNDWGFTITRVFPPEEDEKNEVLRYLAPNGNVLHFSGDPINLLPKKFPDAYGNPLEWGTFIKLYDYHSLGRNATDICRNLIRRLDFLLFGLGLPGKLYERRNFRKDHYDAPLNGLSVVLQRNRSQSLENGFPVSETLSMEENKINFSIYVFKKDATIPYAVKEGVAFLLNGQVQGWLPRSLFAKAELAYIEKHLLVVADISQLLPKVRRKMIMGSRDRLKRNELTLQLETEIVKMLKDQEEVVRINIERRKQQAEHKREMNTVVIEQIKRLAQMNPGIKLLLNPHLKMHVPFDVRDTLPQNVYTGKEFPTFFHLESNPFRTMPKNHEGRMFYRTDAANDYFSRLDLTKKGHYSLDIINPIIDEPFPFHRIGLQNGQATLRFRLPDSVEVGNKLTFRLQIYDKLNRFQTDDFTVEILPPHTAKQGRQSPQQKPPSDDDGTGSKKTDELAPPGIIPIYRSDWEKSDVHWTEYCALRAMASGEGRYDIYLNMDNIFIQQEIKRQKKKLPEELYLQWESAMTLVAMSVLSKNPRIDNQLNPDTNEDPIRPEILIEYVSKVIAPITIPLMNEI